MTVGSAVIGRVKIDDWGGLCGSREELLLFMQSPWHHGQYGYEEFVQDVNVCAGLRWSHPTFRSTIGDNYCAEYLVASWTVEWYRLYN